MATLSSYNCIFTFFAFLNFYIIFFYVLKTSNSDSFFLKTLNNNNRVSKTFYFCFSDLFFCQFILFYYIYISKHLNSLLFLVFLIFLIMCWFLNTVKTNIQFFGTYDLIVPFSLPLITLFVSFCSNYLLFLFYIEILGYLFYFQFLSPQGSKFTNRLVDLFLFYYWSGFVGTIFLFLSAQRFYLLYNTSSFNELYFFNEYYDFFLSIFFFLGLLVKIGASGVHFLKADFYKYVSIITVLNFSVLSTFIYIYIFYFFLNLNIYNIFLFKFFPLFFFLGFLFFSFNLKHMTNLVLYFGYSGVLTTSLSLFVII